MRLHYDGAALDPLTVGVLKALFLPQ